MTRDRGFVCDGEKVSGERAKVIFVVLYLSTLTYAHMTWMYSVYVVYMVGTFLSFVLYVTYQCFAVKNFMCKNTKLCLKERDVCGEHVPLYFAIQHRQQ